jgi:hypothetical protein
MPIEFLTEWSRYQLNRHSHGIKRDRVSTDYSDKQSSENIQLRNVEPDIHLGHLIASKFNVISIELCF